MKNSNKSLRVNNRKNSKGTKKNSRGGQLSLPVAGTVRKDAGRVVRSIRGHYPRARR